MKHQYVGDINDYRKYALLRSLGANGGNHIGVCWMLTPSDGRPDGNKLAYLHQPERYRHFDPPLFDILAHAAAEPDKRRLQTIEDSGVIPGAAYYNELLPDELLDRQAFMDRCPSEFSGTDLVFFDSDNGLEVSIRKGRKNSCKYLYLDEAATFYAAGKSLLIYQHFPRIERRAFTASCVDRLRSIAPASNIWTFATAHVLFILALHPNSKDELHSAAIAACTKWSVGFIKGEYRGSAANN